MPLYHLPAAGCTVLDIVDQQCWHLLSSLHASVGPWPQTSSSLIAFVLIVHVSLTGGWWLLPWAESGVFFASATLGNPSCSVLQLKRVGFPSWHGPHLHRSQIICPVSLSLPPLEWFWSLLLSWTSTFPGFYLHTSLTFCVTSHLSEKPFCYIFAPFHWPDIIMYLLLASFPQLLPVLSRKLCCKP